MSISKIGEVIRNRKLKTETANKLKKIQINSGQETDGQISSGKLLENKFSANFAKARLFAFERKTFLTTKSADSGTFTAEGAAGKYDSGAQTSIEPDAAPAEAAQYLLHYEHHHGGSAYPGEQQFFLKALAEHKNDPAWTQEFFRTLGSEKTSELLSDSVTSGVYHHNSPEQIEGQVDALRDTLANLASAQPPVFTQTDMDLLVEKMIKAPGDLNPQIAMEVFGKMDSGQEKVQNMFFDAASRLALTGRVSTDEAQQLATAATHVLADTSAENQAERLNAVRTGGDGQLDKFIKLAMTGTGTLPSLAGQLAMTNQQPFQNEPYGRVDALVYNIAFSGYHDTNITANVTEADLQATRTELFNTVSQSLTDNSVREKFKENQFLKDGLAQIFMRDFDRILSPPNIGENAAILTTDAQNGLSQFFEFSLFTVQPGYQQKQLMNFLTGKFKIMSQGLNDISPGAEERFRTQFGRSRADAASLLGGLLGTMTIGLRDNNNQIKEDAKSKGEMLGFLFDLTIGNIPGVGGKLSKDLTDKAKKLLGTVTDDVQSEVVDKLKEGAVEEAKKAFIEGNRAKDPQDLLLGLYEGIKTTLPNGDNPGDNKFLSDFLDGYSEVITNPRNVVSGN